MLAAGVDHLWQSLQFSGVACALAWLARGNAAIVRLWLYRIAALKFIVPYHLLFAAGAWLGFPVNHTSKLPPAELVAAAAATTPVFAPVRWLGVGGGWVWFLTVAAIAASVVALRLVMRRMHREEFHVYTERVRLERDPDDRPPGLGMLKGA